MKKIVKILLILFILVLFYTTNGNNLLPLTISFSMYILFSSLFSTTSITKVMGEYHNNKYYYSRNKMFSYTMVGISIIGFILTLVSFIIGKLLNIEYMSIINIFMSLSLLSNVLLKLISEYLDVIGFRKISTNLISLYSIVVLFIDIILCLLFFAIFKININITIILLYSVSIIIFLITLVMLYFLCFYKKSKYNKKRGENKLTYFNQMKKIIVGNKMEIISRLISSTYIYTSIIILYYILLNKYNYNITFVGEVITCTYFYGLILMFFICYYIKKYLNIDYSNIKITFNSNINKIIKLSLHLSILLIIISLPISNLLLNNYNIISNLIPVLFFYILYNYIININIRYCKDKNTIIILIIGLIINIVFEIPFINSIYRMGYSLVLGSTLSMVLGLIVSIILGIIIVKNKFKLNLLNNFNNILNIIYECIIYSSILILFTFIIKIDVIGIIRNILIIIFYIIISLVYCILKKIMIKKNN